MATVTVRAVYSDWKDSEKRLVFRYVLKTGTDDVEVTYRGRPFQIRAAATGNTRSATTERRLSWTISDKVVLYFVNALVHT